MTITRILTAAAAIGGLAATPALAQSSYPYQQPYPQQYPQGGYSYPGQTYPGTTYPGQAYPGQTYPGQTYPGQGYGNGGAIQQVIDQLLGNRYNVSDRTAVRQCAAAAAQQAASQYGPRYGTQGGYGGNGYNGYNGQGFGYDPNRNFRVTSITNVERRTGGLRVSGLLDSRRGYGGNWGAGYNGGGYNGGGYNTAGDLSFRCNVDYRGTVTNVRIRPTSAWRGY